MTDNPRPVVPLKSIADFLVNAPLYETQDASSDQGKKEVASLFSDLRFDCFCPQCGTTQPFLVPDELLRQLAGLRRNRLGGITDQLEQPDSVNGGTVGVIRIKALCQRNPEHGLNFWIGIVLWQLTKLGQFPSLADIVNNESKQFASQLSKVDRAELSKAIGLHAHGIGIGSFVYLRRIFERLLFQKFTEEAETLSLSEDEFRRLPIDQRIKELADHLPPFLTKNSKAIYSLLSIGLHELDEDDCRSMFPALKQAIILILEQEVARKKQQKAEKALQRQLNEFHATTKGGSDVDLKKP